MTKTKREKWPQPIIKALFGRAANRCSICKCLITELPKKEGDKIAVSGEIAHIHALSSDGPRGKSALTEKERNEYENLIVLCANCHTRIDRLEITYPVEELKRIKDEHEAHYENVAPNMDSKRAASLITTYVNEFRTAYSYQASLFVPGDLIVNQQIVSFESEEFRNAIAQNTLIIGGPGLGKTLLAKFIAVQSLDDGAVPIIVEAIQFSKQINPQIENHDQFTLEELQVACAVLKRNVLLTVDGYNECPENLRMKLNLWITGFTNQTNARIIVTSQIRVDGLQNTQLVQIEVTSPSKSNKKKIASVIDKNIDSEKIDPLLNAVSTGLEARLIGEVAQVVDVNASRYSIFDLYARERFAKNAEVGISALANTAAFLYDKVTFSLSARDFSRMMSTKLVGVQSYDFLFTSGLLVKKADRIFFGHELFYNAFAAEAIVRQADGDPGRVIEALKLPKHRNQRDFILGAIDDNSMIEAILPHIEDFDLIAACIAGDCGLYAKLWADKRCTEILSKTQNEIASLSFEIILSTGFTGVESWMVSLIEASTSKWDGQELCFIHALPLLLFKGKHITEIFRIMEQTDQRLSQEFRRLRPEAIEKNIAIRSSMFEQIYVGFGIGQKTSAGIILSNFISGGWSIEEIRPSDRILESAKELAAKPTLSDGQLFLLIHLVQKFRWHYENWKLLLVASLPALLKDRWKSSPYHLKIALLDAAEYSWDATQEQKDEIINELNNLFEICRDDLILSTSIVDALQALGALEQDEIDYEDTVRAEFATIFNGDEDEQKCASAFGLNIRSFDHPYQATYWKVISELPENEAKKFYMMALRGAAAHPTSIGTNVALYQALKYADPSMTDLIVAFTKIPDVDVPTRQDSTETFLVAHIVLGWLGATLHSRLSSDITDAARAYIAYGEIMYWTNRGDLTEDEKKISMQDGWKILLNAQTGASASVLHDFNQIIKHSIRAFAEGKDLSLSLADAYPSEVAEICRECIKQPAIQHGYFKWTRLSEILDHAIYLLGYYGNFTDLPLLKTFTSDLVYGQTSLRAIERIETKHTH